MTARLLFIIVLTVGIRLTVSCSPKADYCYTTDKSPYNQFGPSTSYSIARGEITDILQCQATQVWMVARHGTRYPDIEEFKSFNKLFHIKEQMLANHEANKVSLCKEDINNLKDYVMSLWKNDVGKLTMAGNNELFNLGTKLRKIFMNILNDPNNQGNQYFTTNTQCTQKSADFFTKGIDGIEMYLDNQKTHKMNQNIIYTYANCKKWQEKTERTKKWHKQFETGKLMEALQQDVSKRLGYDEVLDMDSITSMYNACRLQKAWAVNKISPWCAVFNKEELKVLEYGEDLYFYYKSGPGNLALHKKLACPAIKDMIATLSRRVNEPRNDHRASFYFTDHIMLDILQVGLEMSTSDNSLTPDNYSKQKKRQYWTSKTMPFAGNILAVLYECNDGQKRKVAFYRNEEIVQYPGCDKGLCDWEMIRNKFHDYINHESCTDMKWCDEEGK